MTPQPAEALNPSSSSPSHTKVFDPARRYTITIPHPDYNKGKTCTVRFPTDAEWCERYRKQVVVRRNIGRDNVKTETRNEDEANLELFEKIRLDTDDRDTTGDPTPAIFDASEAKLILDRISRCQVIGTVDREGNTYHITMAVPGAEVTHVLKIPTQKQIMDHGRASYQNTAKRNVQETKTLLEPTGDLWDKLTVHYTGYSGETKPPITHKDIALTELMLQFQQDIDEGPDPNE